MSTRVYEKTEKGREEIATRMHQLSVRLRSVLVMIDGRRPVSELLPHLAQLGLDQASFDQLVGQEYIRSLPCAEDDVVVAAPVIARVPPGLRRMHKLYGGNPVPVKPGTMDLAGVSSGEPEMR